MIRQVRRPSAWRIFFFGCMMIFAGWRVASVTSSGLFISLPWMKERHECAYLSKVDADALLEARAYDLGEGMQSRLYIDAGERTDIADLLHHLVDA